jgi:hypothetical protein
LLEGAAHELNAQTVLVCGHRAAIPFAKNARQVDGMDFNLRGDCFECKGLAVGPVEEFKRTLQPNRIAGFVV